jgi:hypothetical protein
MQCVWQLVRAQVECADWPLGVEQPQGRRSKSPRYRGNCCKEGGAEAAGHYQSGLPAFQYVWNVLGQGLVDDENGKYFTSIYELASVFHPPSCLANLQGPTFVLAKLLEDVHVVRLLGKPLCATMAADYGKLTTACFPFKDDKFKPHTLLDWWREHARETGSWAAAARLFVLCQPNSELAERAGAILRARTSDQQGKQLDETFEVSSMLAFKYAETRKLAK